MTELGKKVMNGIVSEIPESKLKKQSPTPPPDKQKIEGLITSGNTMRGLRTLRLRDKQAKAKKAGNADVLELPKFIEKRNKEIQQAKRAQRKEMRALRILEKQTIPQRFLTWVLHLFK